MIARLCTCWGMWSSVGNFMTSVPSFHPSKGSDLAQVSTCFVISLTLRCAVGLLSGSLVTFYHYPDKDTEHTWHLGMSLFVTPSSNLQKNIIAFLSHIPKC